ncbi:MAG TPA: dihydroorotase family protein [Actinomycetota bacterium]|nr:dihydroorotase family protein [Actinomycetota bacterium]
MARYDVVVTGGTLVIPFVGEVRGDIAIKDGRIASIAGDLGPGDADEAIDARGKHVFPGAVDSHYHLGIYRGLTEDTESETTSSLVGGVTTVISYFRTGSHYLNKTGPYRQIFPEVLAAVDGHAKVDYGFHLAPMTAEHIAEIPWLVSEMGVASFKYYMFYKGLNLSADSRDAKGYTMSEEYDLGHLFEIMEAVSAADLAHDGRISLSLHCEQAELLRVFIERAKQDPSVRGLAEYAAGRPPLTEQLSIEEAGVLADATHVRTNFLHLSSGEALDKANEVRHRYGLDANLEVTVHHLALNVAMLEGKGLGGKVNPPIRDAEDNEALWQGLADGRIGTVASDHACCMEESKGEDLWPALPGFGGTALLYPVLISEGHHKRGIPLDRIAQVASAAPARTYNLYPRKGTIAVGADADLAIIDVGLEQIVTPELCRSAQDHTPFSGVAVRGWPAATLVRGIPMYRQGEIANDFPGLYLRRT